MPFRVTEVLIVALCAAFVSACSQYRPIYNVPDTRTNAAGHLLRFQDVESAILDAGSDQKWSMIVKGPGAITGVKFRRHRRTEIHVGYTSEAFRIALMSSDLQRNYNRNVVHWRVNEWIKQLETAIKARLSRLETVAVRTEPTAVPTKTSASSTMPLDSADSRFRQPLVGTEFVYEHSTFVVSETDGYRMTIRKVGGDYDGTETHYYSIIKRITVGGTYTTDYESIRRLWPLEIGKSARLETRRDGGVWRTDLRVTGKEKRKLEGVDYTCFIVEEKQVSLSAEPGQAYSHTIRLWVSPVLAAVLKSDRVETGGEYAGRSRHFELQRVIYPDGTFPEVYYPQ